MASLIPRAAGSPTLFLSSASAVLTTTAVFSTFSTTQVQGLIMNDIVTDNQALSSSFQSSVFGTPTTSSIRNTSISINSDVMRRLPLAGPLVAGILVGIILITTIVVICFLQHRPKHKRRHRLLGSQYISQPESYPHQRSRNRSLLDEISSQNDPSKKKYHRYSRPSRHSNDTMELDVPNSQIMEDRSSDDRQWHSRSGSTNSTSSITLNTNNMVVNKPSRETADGTQTSTALVSNLGTVSSNQVEQYTPSTSRINPLVQPPSPSSQIELLHTQNRKNSALPPEVGPRLNTLIQQRATLLASRNTSDKSVYNELLHLEEQIRILRRQNVFPPRQDTTPPPYEAQR